MINLELSFDDNRLLPLLFGEHGQFLTRLEKQTGTRLMSRGNILLIAGEDESAQAARAAILALWDRVKAGMPVGPGEVDAAARLAISADVQTSGNALAQLSDPRAGLKTKRRTITPRSGTQARYLEALAESELVFGLGPAGTGKTYLAVAQAVSLLMQGSIERIILSRPAVEAGERLGFLPGDMKEKVDPYLRPLYDALHDMLPGDQVTKRLETGVIEVAPLAFMRGRTLAHAFVILDEAQNTTPMQMKMFLTRLGEGSRMVVTGDVTQIDLPTGQKSGLREALTILRGVEGVSFVEFTDQDVVRHPLVGRIVRAYDAADRAREGA
ncbi:PhoH family protein [Niveispirillum cyanobacteriorum]|uniref:PhoH family protein n=1 Tax=Niveispirillum cyanobacteriorum TaxID=1612173 RepID=UPI0016651815|nr:PhoH family protein [Niveispirillum cyanobacteriorum]GGE56045.1 phosphate starvation protein PhoH [Niveispirillum cyanobacteriorum]